MFPYVFFKFILRLIPVQYQHLENQNIRVRICIST